MIVFSDLAVVQVSLPEVVIEPVFIPYTFNRAAPFPLGAEETVPCGYLTFTRRETTHQTGQGSGLDEALYIHQSIHAFVLQRLACFASQALGRDCRGGSSSGKSSAASNLTAKYGAPFIRGLPQESVLDSPGLSAARGRK
jgi:hypothetical protein